jgi:S-formylglutathione hydrolase FrmB
MAAERGSFMTHNGISRRTVSRRTVLGAGLGLTAAAGVAGGGYGLVEAGVLPGKYALDRVLGACGGPPPPPDGPRPARHEARFFSAYRRREVSMVTLIPAGLSSPRGLGVAVALHGLGGDAAATARTLATAMAALPAGRARSLAVVTVDGGGTYWHRRADGDDPAGMIRHEVLPRAAALGLRTARIAVVGQSMGGYGALLFAEQHPAAVGAVAAISPAIFGSYADARRADPRSFDGAADFGRNDVLAHLTALRGMPAYVACGQDDPFEPMARQLRMRLCRVAGHPPAGALEAGCHDRAFWSRHLPAALAYLSPHLA